MISDSIPWRDELLRVADRLARKTKQERWTERSSFLVERDLMTSAYAIRRLLEAQKLSSATYSATVPAIRYTARGKVPDVWNRHELEELYDLDSPTKTQLSLRKYCNQLIHSYVFQLNADEDSDLFDGVFVASEKDCREQVFFLPAKSMIEVCVKIGREEIWGVNLRRDKDGTAYWVSYTREEIELNRLHNPPFDDSSG